MGIAAPGFAELQESVLGAGGCFISPPECTQFGVFTRNLWLYVPNECGEWEFPKLCPFHGISWTRGAKLSPTAAGSCQLLCLARSPVWIFSHIWWDLTVIETIPRPPSLRGGAVQMFVQGYL